MDSKRKLTTEEVEQIIAKFQPFVVEVPKRWHRKTDPSMYFPHLCFEKAFWFVCDHNIRSMWLVHGRFTKPKRHHHAWVELPNDVVFDGVHQCFYHNDYIDVQGLVAYRRYDKIVALRAALVSGHMGPWSMADLKRADGLKRRDLT